MTSLRLIESSLFALKILSKHNSGKKLFRPLVFGASGIHTPQTMSFRKPNESLQQQSLFLFHVFCVSSKVYVLFRRQYIINI